MGHRALIGKTLPSGEVEIYYSQWGALNAYDAEGKIEVPEEEEEERWTVKDRFAFGREIDFLHHEAIWLDGVCYCPVWVFPSEGVPVEKWKTKGQGILLKAENGIEFNQHKCLSNFRHIMEDLMDMFDVNIGMRQAIIENYVVGESTESTIPDFSPMGHKKYVSMRDIFTEKLNGWKNGEADKNK